MVAPSLEPSNHRRSRAATDMVLPNISLVTGMVPQTISLVTDLVLHSISLAMTLHSQVLQNEWVSCLQDTHVLHTGIIHPLANRRCGVPPNHKIQHLFRMYTLLNRASLLLCFNLRPHLNVYPLMCLHLHLHPHYFHHYSRRLRPLLLLRRRLPPPLPHLHLHLRPHYFHQYSRRLENQPPSHLRLSQNPRLSPLVPHLCHLVLHLCHRVLHLCHRVLHLCHRVLHLCHRVPHPRLLRQHQVDHSVPAI